MSFNGLHLLDPGERFQPWPKPPAPPNPPPLVAKQEPTDCEGCGAPLQHHLASCAWCTRPHRSRRADLGALIEVTCQDDVAPRYVVGWETPRPVPPASRLVRECAVAKGADGLVHASTAQEWRNRYSARDETWWIVGASIAVPAVLFAFAVWLVNP